MCHFSQSLHIHVWFLFLPLYFGVVEEKMEECWFDLEEFDGEDLFKKMKRYFSLLRLEQSFPFLDGK